MLSYIYLARRARRHIRRRRLAPTAVEILRRLMPILAADLLGAGQDIALARVHQLGPGLPLFSRPHFAGHDVDDERGRVSLR